MHIGVLIGTGLGYFGWVMGLAIVVLRSGDWAAVVDVLLPATVVTAGLFGSLVICLVPFTGSERRADLLWVLFGRLAFDFGLIGTLLRQWILPRLSEDAGNLDALRSTGSTVEVPLLLGWPMMAAGAVLLTLSARRLLRTNPGP